MHFFLRPTEYFISPMPPAEMLRRMHYFTSSNPSSNNLFSDEAAVFVGSVNSCSFKVQRIAQHKSAMLPRINGYVQSSHTGRGSTLTLHYRIPESRILAAVLWLVCVGAIMVGSQLAWLVFGIFNFFTVATAGAFLLSLVGFTVSFWLEVQTSRELLIRLLQLEKSAAA